MDSTQEINWKLKWNVSLTTKNGFETSFTPLLLPFQTIYGALVENKCHIRRDYN